MHPSHVLVPLDGSPLADDALVHALATFDCRVTVLNVVTPLDSGMSEGGILEADDDRESKARDHAEELIERARNRASSEGRSVETAIRTGDPAEEIIAFAQSEDVDHIVMGGHGGDRGRITRRLLGTVATAVVSDAPVTVTVVR
jgi:nucleotide-binding universal stress UspA family protein